MFKKFWDIFKNDWQHYPKKSRVLREIFQMRKKTEKEFEKTEEKRYNKNTIIFTQKTEGENSYEHNNNREGY